LNIDLLLQVSWELGFGQKMVKNSVPILGEGPLFIFPILGEHPLFHQIYGSKTQLRLFTQKIPVHSVFFVRFLSILGLIDLIIILIFFLIVAILLANF
jgi:hypothetical protein